MYPVTDFASAACLLVFMCLQLFFRNFVNFPTAQVLMGYQAGQGSRRFGVIGKKKVSKEQVNVMNVFIAAPEQWFDCNAVAHTTELPGSTIRHLLFTFFKMELLNRLEVFGGYKYCLSAAASTHPYFARVRDATTVMQPWNRSKLTSTSAAGSKQAG